MSETFVLSVGKRYALDKARTFADETTIRNDLAFEQVKADTGSRETAVRQHAERAVAGQGRSPSATADSRERPEERATLARLETLRTMRYADLRREWRRLFRAEAPQRVGRDLLMLGVAWRLQEQVYGGLGATVKRQLADLAKTLERDGDITRSRVARLRPGAKLIREWRGETHTVIVREEGFEWRGKHWRSLSVIAREITGGHWSGPRFFAVRNKVSVRADAMVPGDA